MTLKGEHADRWAHPTKRYPADRVCASSECQTVLSMYNSRAYCWVHDVTRRKAVSEWKRSPISK